MYSGGVDDAAEQARRQESDRQYRVKQGIGEIDKNFTQFDEPFYNQRRQDYLNYATPEFQREFTDTRGTLAANMARRGLLNSSAAIRAGESLQKYAGQKTREIADTAQSGENQLRQEVSGQRTNLVNQVIASGDPTVGSTGALTAATALRAPSAFQPLGNFFDDWTRVYAANQYANAQNPNVPSMFSFGQPQYQSSQRIVGG